MSSARRAAPAVLLAAALLGVARPALATRSPYGRVAPAVELPLAGTAVLAAYALPRLLTPPRQAGPPCGDCVPGDVVLGIDRSVIGNRSPGAALASDLLLGSLVLTSVAVSAVDVAIAGDAGDGLDGWGRDATVVGEVLAANFVLNELIKHLVARPRPLAYDPQVAIAARTARAARLSFYSGHASTAFAAAAATSYTYFGRHDSTVGRALILSLTMSAATSIAYLRVRAGKHFVSDVAVGALVGGALGVLIPLAHAAGGGASSQQGAIVVPVLAAGGAF